MRIITTILITLSMLGIGLSEAQAQQSADGATYRIYRYEAEGLEMLTGAAKSAPTEAPEEAAGEARAEIEAGESAEETTSAEESAETDNAEAPVESPDFANPAVLVPIMVQSPGLRAALEAPLTEEAGWKVASSGQAKGGSQTAGRSGAIISIDDQMRLKQLPLDLSGNILAAIKAPAEASAGDLAAARLALLKALKAELDRDAPSAARIHLLLETLASL